VLRPPEIKMGWELELTDAVYNNDDELIRQYLSTKEVKKSIGEKNRSLVNSFIPNVG
jgi:hypothetical protein